LTCGVMGVMKDERKTYALTLLDKIEELTNEIRRLEEENKRLEKELERARDKAKFMEDDGK